MNGTGLSEWAVSGEPSSSSISSALPWSATMSRRRRVAVHRLDHAAEALVDGLDRLHRRLDDAGVADHVGVGEVDDPEHRAVLAPSGARTRRRPRARSSPACGRRSGRRAGESTSSRTSPSYGSSSPPLKKYVTCGYFSVSATCSCVSPRPAMTVASVTVGPRGREGDRVRPALLVLGQRRVAVDARLGQRLGDLAHPVGAEVERDHRVAGADRRASSPTVVGGDELVGLVALVGRLGGRLAGRRPRARPRPRRAARTPSRCGPSACRGPSRSSGRRRSRCARRPPRRTSPSTVREDRAPPCRRRVAPVGEGVDDEVLARPRFAASSISAWRWRSAECTPPSETRPIRCTRGASRSASCSTSFSASEPSSTASSMRSRSCGTTAPAPRLRWPTSELPIWPAGRPTASPQAVSVRVVVASPRARRRPACRRARPRCPGPRAPAPSRRG